MSDPKQPAAFLILASPGIEVRSIEGKPPRQLKSVSNALVQPALAGDVLLVGGVQILFGPELDLEDDSVVRCRFGQTSPDFLRSNGAEILAEARAAAASRDLPALRRLCLWFGGLVRRMPEVSVLLDQLPRTRALQVAGLRKGRGRPSESGRLLALLHTMERLVTTKGLTAAEAARRLSKVQGSDAGEARLKNLYTAHRHHARIRDQGLFVPASELEPTAWGDPKEDWSVFAPDCST